MSRERDALFDMLEYATLAMEHLAGKTVEELRENIQLRNAVLYELAVIGEAATRISQETKLRFPGIPWPIVIGMRNVLVHEYERVNVVKVFDTVRRDLPELVRVLTEALEKERDE